MRKGSTRRGRERKTIEAMIALYCRKHHAADGDLCAECAALTEYARQRLEKCPFGDQKPTCATCPIHCYRGKRGFVATSGTSTNCRRTCRIKLWTNVRS